MVPALAGKQFEARYFIAQKDEWKHYLSYWFMWRDSRRLMHDGAVMFRIAVSMDTISEETAKAKTRDFIKSVSEYSGDEHSPLEIASLQEEPVFWQEASLFVLCFPCGPSRLK